MRITSQIFQKISMGILMSPKHCKRTVYPQGGKSLQGIASMVKRVKKAMWLPSKVK